MSLTVSAVAVTPSFTVTLVVVHVTTTMVGGTAARYWTVNESTAWQGMWRTPSSTSLMVGLHWDHLHRTWSDPQYEFTLLYCNAVLWTNHGCNTSVSSLMFLNMCCAVLCCAVLCCSVLFCAVLCCALSYCCALCCADMPLANSQYHMNELLLSLAHTHR
jgi:hypothetical protein